MNLKSRKEQEEQQEPSYRDIKTHPELVFMPPLESEYPELELADKSDELFEAMKRVTL